MVGSLKIADDQHLYMPDSFGRTVLSGRRRSGPAAFGHDKDGSLALASTPSLQRTVLLVFRSFGGKEALVHFHIPMKGVKAVAPAHHIAQLMHHCPYLGMKKSYLHKLMMKKEIPSTNQTANCASLTRTNLINGRRIRIAPQEEVDRQAIAYVTQKDLLK